MGDENDTADPVAVAVDCDAPSTVASVVAVGDDLNDSLGNSDDDVPIAVTQILFEPLEGARSSPSSRGADHEPSIISVTVLKSDKTAESGLSFEKIDDGIGISNIESEGIFGDTPIAQGDVVLSVNNDSCQDESARRVSRLIQRSNESVTLIVRRKEGNPYIVSSTVSKSTPESRVGIGVQRNHEGSLCISSIDPHGLFAGGILNVGDKVVSIGGVPCPCMDSTSAIELVRKEEKRVTIVAWTEKEAGVVVAARNVSFGKSFCSLLWMWRKHIMIISITFSIVGLIAIIVATTTEKTPCEDLGQRPLPVARECP